MQNASRIGGFKFVTDSLHDVSSFPARLGQSVVSLIIVGQAAAASHHAPGAGLSAVSKTRSRIGRKCQACAWCAYLGRRQYENGSGDDASRLFVDGATTAQGER